MLSTLTEEIGPRPLGLARIIIGGAAVLRAYVAWPVLSKLAEPDILRAPYAEWLPEPTPGLVTALAVVWIVSALSFMVGWRVSWTGPLLLASLVTTLLLDQQAYSNHLYLLAWLVLLLTLADSGAGLSIGRRERHVVRWPVLLIMTQASIVYGFSAITKLNPDFLSGRVLASVIHGGLVTFPESWRTPTLLSTLSVIVVMSELFLAVFLWSSSFRPTAFILGLGLHTGITMMMAATGELLVFSLEMLALYPLFLDRKPLHLRWNSHCLRCPQVADALKRFDLLEVVEFEEKSPSRGLSNLTGDIELAHGDRLTRGSVAITRVFEHLVPWLWFAPILRLPGLRRAGKALLASYLLAPSIDEPDRTSF